ncbi:MAG: hypothetical protein PSX36_01515 [bacterium]|nr:hypothetical protein [bacterium]
MRNVRLVLVCFSVTSLFIMACEKKESMEVDNETQSVVDYALVDQEIMAVFPAVFQHMARTPGAGAEAKAGFVCDPFSYVSGDTVSFKPNPVFSLDLSKTSCSLPDGKTRSGKITVRLSGKFKLTGTSSVIKFENYSAAGLLYSCDSMVVLNKGSNTSFYSFGVKLLNGTCTGPSFKISYACDKTMAVYAVGDASATGPLASNYGSVQGTNRQGLPFLVNITTDIVKHNNCSYFEQGKMTIHPQGFKDRLVDFGNGTCDDQATFAVNENTVAFKLK